MPRRLDVYLRDRMVGVLEQNDAGQLRFQYAGDWLADPARLALSQSLPLRPEPFDSAATRPFFAGLLPEAEKRDLIAQALGVSTRNEIGRAHV